MIKKKKTIKEKVENMKAFLNFWGTISLMAAGVSVSTFLINKSCENEQKEREEITWSLEKRFYMPIKYYKILGSCKKNDTIIVELNGMEYLVKNDSLISYLKKGPSQKEGFFLPDPNNPRKFITPPGTDVPYILP